MSIKSPLFPLMIKYQAGLISRDFVLDYIGDAVLMTKDEAIVARMIKPGKLYTDKGQPYVCTVASSDKHVDAAEKVFFSKDYKLSFYDRFTLEKGMIANHTGNNIQTTIGVFLLNYVCLVAPFGSTISYVNGKWDIEKIEDQIAELVISHKVLPKQVLKYIDNVYSLCGLNDLCVPALSEKCVTSNPAVSKRREELFKEYKDQMHDPNVMMKIEDELISMDKAALKGDSSNGFLISGKAYDVQRKRMFLMLGLVESFGDEVPSFSFGKTNLNDGWDLKEMEVIANDTRRGIYNRGTETRLGGAESKMIGRNFQEAAIVEPDCGTKRGLPVYLTKINAKSFENRNIIEKGELVKLTKDNIEKYIGKNILVRSPMYCSSMNGYCYACMDTRFEDAGIKLMNIHPLGISSTILKLSLKSMHGTKASILNIDNLNDHVV